MGYVPITTRSSRELYEREQRMSEINNDNAFYKWVINSFAKSCRCHHHVLFTVKPRIHLVFPIINVSMIADWTKVEPTIFGKCSKELLCLISAWTIDDHFIPIRNDMFLKEIEDSTNLFRNSIIINSGNNGLNTISDFRAIGLFSK